MGELAWALAGVSAGVPCGVVVGKLWGEQAWFKTSMREFAATIPPPGSATAYLEQARSGQQQSVGAHGHDGPCSHELGCW